MNVKIILAHYNEDINWISNLKNEYIIISKTLSTNDKIYHTPINKGNESSAYLEYLVNFYDEIDKYDKLIFLHAHQNSWHQKYDSDFLINNLNFDFDFDFLSFCDDMYYEIDNNIITQSGKNAYKVSDERVIEMIKKYWSLFEDVCEESPNRLGLIPGAQFIVDTKLVLKYSKNFYKNNLDFIYKNEDITPYGIRIAHLYEWLWHYIFTNNTYEEIKKIEIYLK